jgi:hypothetical protein
VDVRVYSSRPARRDPNRKDNGKVTVGIFARTT